MSNKTAGKKDETGKAEEARNEKLWPYRRSLAFLAIPIVWIFFAILFMLGQRYAGWDKTLQSVVILVVGIISFLPVLFLLLDFFSTRGAVLDIKGVKFDFSKINIERSGIKRESFGLPDNIGITGPLISDTSPMDIIERLKTVVQYEVIVINIKSGESWWVTRLLALSAGAMRAGSPSVFVFIGKKENIENVFLGLAKPSAILDAILKDKDQYRIRYEKAIRIARQVLILKDSPLRPLLDTLAPPAIPDLITPFDVQRYINDPRYAVLSEEVTEQIIMDQMANNFAYAPEGSLEQNPDKLKLKRLEELFGTCLYKSEIDLDAENEEQIDMLLKSKSSYIALVRNGQYDSILKQSDGEKLILKELFSQSKKH